MSQRETEPGAEPGATAPADARPGLLDALGVLLLAYLLGGAAGSTASAGLDGPLGDAAGLAVFSLVLGLAALGWPAARRGIAGVRAALGPAPAAAHLGAGVGIGLVCGLVLNLLLPPLLEVLLERVGLDPPTVQESARQALTEPASRLVAAVGVMVVAPLGEELCFRGVVFRALRRHLGLVVAGLASALVFAGLHTVGHSLLGAVYLLVSLGVVGVVLAVLVERQRHLWGAVLAHAVFNAVAVGAIWAA